MTYDVTPRRMSSANDDDYTDSHNQPVIGLIGMGAMGRMYATLLSDAGWNRSELHSSNLLTLFQPISRIHVCDLPSKYENLKREYDGM